MTEIVPFDPEHFNGMDLRDPAAVHGYGPEYRDLLGRYAQWGPAWTLLSDGRPIMSGGVVILWPGVGEAWTLISKQVTDYPLAAVKALRKCIAEAVERHGLRRIQATARRNDDRAVALLHVLGFKVEGLMPRYGPDGEDYYMCGRVIPWKS